MHALEPYVAEADWVIYIRGDPKSVTILIAWHSQIIHETDCTYLRHVVHNRTLRILSASPVRQTEAHW